jgi:hypothetical protein
MWKRIEAHCGRCVSLIFADMFVRAVRLKICTAIFSSDEKISALLSACIPCREGRQ